MSICYYVPADQAGTSANTNDEATDLETGGSESPTPDSSQLTLTQFWNKVMEDVKKVTPDDFKTQVLPLARIKKIMKLDEDVKMISAEAPLLFAKAAEIFIHELTLRAWVHTEDNKRRTLQRNDIAMAITKSDQFDFLIDIVPRQDVKPPKPREEVVTRPSVNSDQVHYYFQLAQQQAALGAQQVQVLQPQQVQQLQQVQLQQPQQQQQNVQNVSSVAGPTAGTSMVVGNQPVTVLQQVVTPSGEIQQVPIQLSQQQLNLIRMQMQNNPGQPILIQSQPNAIQMNAQQPQQVYLTQLNTSQEGD